MDGDTFIARVDGVRERIRLIGIDTPESVAPDRPVECYGRAASAAATRLLAGREVTLEPDEERRDRYGRLLMYAWRGELLVNAELVRLGYATTLRIPPNTRYAGKLAALEREARRARRGLWGVCST